MRDFTTHLAVASSVLLLSGCATGEDVSLAAKAPAAVRASAAAGQAQPPRSGAGGAGVLLIGGNVALPGSFASPAAVAPPPAAPTTVGTTAVTPGERAPAPAVATSAVPGASVATLPQNSSVSANSPGVSLAQTTGQTTGQATANTTLVAPTVTPVAAGPVTPPAATGSAGGALGTSIAVAGQPLTSPGAPLAGVSAGGSTGGAVVGGGPLVAAPTSTSGPALSTTGTQTAALDPAPLTAVGGGALSTSVAPAPVAGPLTSSGLGSAGPPGQATGGPPGQEKDHGKPDKLPHGG